MMQELGIILIDREVVKEFEEQETIKRAIHCSRILENPSTN